MSQPKMITEIEAHGFYPRKIQSYHYRLMAPRHGWIDIWPTSERWRQSMRKGGVVGAGGVGAESLLDFLRTAPEIGKAAHAPSCRSCLFSGLTPRSENDVHLDGQMVGTCAIHGKRLVGGCSVFAPDDMERAPTQSEIRAAKEAFHG